MPKMTGTDRRQFLRPAPVLTLQHPGRDLSSPDLPDLPSEAVHPHFQLRAGYTPEDLRQFFMKTGPQFPGIYCFSGDLTGTGTTNDVLGRVRVDSCLVDMGQRIAGSFRGLAYLPFAPGGDELAGFVEASRDTRRPYDASERFEEFRRSTLRVRDSHFPLDDIGVQRTEQLNRIKGHINRAIDLCTEECHRSGQIFSPERMQQWLIKSGLTPLSSDSSKEGLSDALLRYAKQVDLRVDNSGEILPERRRTILGLTIGVVKIDAPLDPQTAHIALSRADQLRAKAQKAGRPFTLAEETLSGFQERRQGEAEHVSWLAEADDRCRLLRRELEQLDPRDRREYHEKTRSLWLEYAADRALGPTVIRAERVADREFLHMLGIFDATRPVELHFIGLNNEGFGAENKAFGFSGGNQRLRQCAETTSKILGGLRADGISESFGSDLHFLVGSGMFTVREVMPHRETLRIWEDKLSELRNQPLTAPIGMSQQEATNVMVVDNAARTAFRAELLNALNELLEAGYYKTNPGYGEEEVERVVANLGHLNQRGTASDMRTETTTLAIAPGESVRDVVARVGIGNIIVPRRGIRKTA